MHAGRHTWLFALSLAACTASTEPGSSLTEESEDPGESDTGAPAPPLGDDCEHTPLILEAPTTLPATLRHASPAPAPLAEACPTLTGPTIFAEATVHGRADLTVEVRGRSFTPRFAVLLPGCSSDPERVLACGDALPITLTDLGPDVELLLAIASSADDPALALAPEPGADPLDLELRLEVRPVLAELDRCGPAYGRCEAGTVCLPATEGEAEVERCRRPPADSCQAPGTAAVPEPGAELVIVIPSDEPHSDAHEHDCGGWRRVERVERLVLPTGLSAGASLEVEADDPRVGLALRGPDCAPERQLDCAPATGAGDSTTLSYAEPGALAALAAADEGPLLFIELPSVDPPVDVEVRVRVLD